MDDDQGPVPLSRYPRRMRELIEAGVVRPARRIGPGIDEIRQMLTDAARRRGVGG